MNPTSIKCPHCQKEIAIEDALRHQIEEQVTATLSVENSRKIEAARKLAQDEAEKKISKQVELQMQNLQKEKDEEKARNLELTKQLNELLDEVRKMRRRDEERDTEYKKKLMEEETKIQQEAIKKVQDDHHLKDLEKDKRLQDSLKQVEELKAKMQQGSQQIQGEVLELELQELISKEFPTDIVSEVAKGVRGADIIQQVIDRKGQKCGVILWESKNAQWSDKWVDKLREDQRTVKADLAVLVSVNLPEKIKYYIYQDGVWITSRQTAITLSYSLRFNLVQAQFLKQSQEGKKEKADALYSYLCGHEFRQRVEGMLEHYTNLQKEMEQEKRWFALKWARQEKSLRTMIDQTSGFYGDLQHLIGSDKLPQIGMLEETQD